MSIPDSSVMVPCRRNHDSCHNGSDIESRPDRHKFGEQFLFLEVDVSPLSQSFLNWHSSGVVKWVWIVSVIVGLN